MIDEFIQGKDNNGLLILLPKKDFQKQINSIKDNE